VFDAVVSGQAWHWIDAAAGTAAAARLLRPGGRLALFWNVGEPASDIAAAFGDVYRSVDTGLPFTPWAGGVSAVDGYLRSIVEPAAEGIRASGLFAEPVLRRFDWSTAITREDWLDQVPTSGGHNRIPAERLAELLDGLGRVVDAHGGSFVMEYATLLVMAERNAV
jgi:SAM-dependent methyltransferase